MSLVEKYSLELTLTGACGIFINDNRNLKEIMCADHSGRCGRASPVGWRFFMAVNDRRQTEQRRLAS